jgi:hypothetical protein
MLKAWETTSNILELSQQELDKVNGGVVRKQQPVELDAVGRPNSRYRFFQNTF